jgi:hypothetical protein
VIVSEILAVAAPLIVAVHVNVIVPRGRDRFSPVAQTRPAESAEISDPYHLIR